VAAFAQETAAATNVAAADADAGAPLDATGTLGQEELDALTSPTALLPDELLGQVLVATTYPVDVNKADRFLLKNPDLSAKDRAYAVNKEDWLCCTNPMRDSSCESSVVAGLHEQTHISRLQDQELARIQ